MRNIIALFAIAILFLAATAAFTAEIKAVETKVRGMTLYEPDPNCTTFFNQHKLLVYSRTSRNGEQTDVVRAGNFFDECFVKDNKIHVRRCGNVVYQIGVENEVIIPAGRDGKNGSQGPKGDRGERGPRGPAGKTIRVEVPGPTVVIMPQNAQPLWAVTNGPQPYGQTVSPGAPAMGGFVYAPSNIRLTSSSSSSSCATGGLGGSVGPIDINNANNNVPVNNNVIAIDGTANGTANGAGTSTAGHLPPTGN